MHNADMPAWRDLSSRGRLGVIAVLYAMALIFAIGALVFRADGAELQRSHARAWATVTAKESDGRYGPEYTLAFAEQTGRARVVRASALRSAHRVGDRLQIYYSPGGGTEITAVGEGSPGSPQFGGAIVFAVISAICLALAIGPTITRIRRRRAEHGPFRGYMPVGSPQGSVRELRRFSGR